jgi:hypothetical protein
MASKSIMPVFNIFRFALPILLFLNTPILSAPVPFNFGAWIKGQLSPEAGKNTRGEIQCYSLPFGGLGFLSHILTYWSMICTMAGKKPLWPGSHLTSGLWDVLLGILSVLGTIVPTCFTISACRNRWQFVLIGVWKLTLTLSANATALHQAIVLWRTGSADEGGKRLWTLIIYVLGTTAGLTGLISLVSESLDDNAHLRIVTYVFGGIVGFPAALFTLWLLYLLFSWPILKCMDSRKYGKMWGLTSFTSFILLLVLLAAFYSDWALAALSNNWLGSPDDDNKELYWLYFGSKRLLLLFL